MAELNQVFMAQRTLIRSGIVPSYYERIENLKKLEKAIKDNVDNIVQAIVSDFGCRSENEIKLVEIFTSISSLVYTRKNLKKWMKPEKRHVSWLHQPAKARVLTQAKGVVGIISPWNYPFFLCIAPLATALAAGNRVMLKPSEISPNTSELLQKMLGELFSDDLVHVSTGGVEVGQAFSQLPFDHLFFTGSTQLGRIIMKAAAENLTPVTLELGGKSPVLLHRDYPIASFAKRIIHTKTMNSGQTCVAPDYLFVHKDDVDEVVQHLKAEFNKSFSNIAENDDYTAIINEKSFERLKSYLADAQTNGATLMPLQDSETAENEAKRKMPLTLVLNPTDDMLLMQDEIFGSILPIMTYVNIDEAIDYINNHERPLAFYYFDDNKKRAADILARTTSGNACVNEALMHAAIDDLPFGGVGASGIGSYHGREGFETFSHKRGVLYKPKFNATNFIAPPYTDTIKRMLQFLIK